MHVQHTFLYISLPFLHEYDVKMPNFMFYKGRKQSTTKFSISFLTWIRLLRIQLQESTFDKVSMMEESRWPSRWRLRNREFTFYPDLASTRFRIHSVFKNFHSRERIQKVADSYADFTGYEWTEAVSEKKKLRIQKYLDTCGRGLSLSHFCLSFYTREHSLLLCTLVMRRNGGSAWISLSLWSPRLLNFWTSH